MRHLLLLLLLVSFQFGFAQLVTTNPVFPTPDKPVTVTFNATGTALEGYTGDLYTHTGVTIEGIGRWQQVIKEWGDNTQPKLTRIDVDIYQLEITPSINDFYIVPSGEKVTELCFVFRNSAGDAQSADLFVAVYESGLSVALLTPETNILVLPSDTIEIKAASNLADSLILFHDNTRISATNEAEINASWIAETNGKHWIKVEAKDANSSVFDSVFYYVRDTTPVAELPTGVKDGINYIDDHTVTLVLCAPHKQFSFLQGDFNDWDYTEPITTQMSGSKVAQVSTTTWQMNQTPDSTYFWITMGNLEAGKEYRYQYLVDGEINIADPYSEKILDPWNDKNIASETYPNLISYPEGKATQPVSVLQTAQADYPWTVTNFTPPAVTDMVVYELLIRDFVAKHDYKTLIDTINYIKNLGVNVVELMPVNEFEGNESWGYNPSFYFAPDKYYGPGADLKKFIDVCHANGMAVVIDMVLNHSFGQSPMVRLYWDAANNRPAEDNPWFNPIAKHDYNVGFDMNHESQYTKKFASRVMRFWLEKYHIDGYRFDLSKGFTQKNTLGHVDVWGQYDATRIAIWKQYADTIKTVKQNAYIILEHFADNTEEKELANYGMLLWDNLNGPYLQSSMGYASNSDFSWISYEKRGWTVPNAVGYMESHDEERMLFKDITYGNSNGDYSTKELTTALRRAELCATFFLTIPGPKMIWQFGELGYDVSIEFNGRVGNKPIHWEYFNDNLRKRLYDTYSALAKLKTSEPVFETTDYSLSVATAMKSIHLTSETMDVTILGNFDVKEGTIVPAFQQTGEWYEYFTGDSIDVTDVNANITMAPGEYRLYTTRRFEKPDINPSVWDNKYNSSSLNDLIIYPNPVSNELYILNNGNYQTISVYNVIGNEVMHLDNQPAGSVIETGHLKSGIYILSGTDQSGQRHTGRFVKQ